VADSYLASVVGLIGGTMTVIFGCLAKSRNELRI
jgi:hypothetical protein